MGTPEPIPADPLEGSPELKKHELAQSNMALARQLQRGKTLTRALDYAHRATLAEPDSHEAQKLMGDLLWSAGRKEEAKEYYRAFLKLHPPSLREKEEVGTLLTR